MSDIIYNPYLTGKTISNYSNILLQCNHGNTQTYTQITQHKQDQNRKTHTETEKNYYNQWYHLQSIYNRHDY